MRSPRPPLPVLIGILALVAIALVRSGEIRERASDGLGRGMPAREGELARGFVLGEDERIDAETKEDFRRSGLSHLLAVSGQNVTLLALLAMPVMAALGIPLRERLVWVLGLIVIYVPLAGAGPSIQRAGVMGAAGVLASLAGRRASRLYALLLAVGVTVAIDPGVAADIGWQLSFAAVTGIFLLASPLREPIAARLGSSGWRRALAEGAAVTIAATLATAPLIAFHFETLSTTTLVANLLAMPAVAPAMWLGMATAAAAQVPGLPVEALNWLNALLLGYVAQVAAWCGRASWAEVQVRLGLGGLAASYLGIALAALTWMRFARAKRIAAARAGGSTRGSPFIRMAVEKSTARATRSLFALLALFVVGIGGWMAVAPGADGGIRPVPGLRVEVLDVGQGDAILLQPAGAPPLLVDGGPPGDGLAGKLEDAGVERLGAAVVTHDQSDHAGGIEETLGRVPIARLVYARLGRPLLERARAAGAVPIRAAAGGELRSGGLRLEVLWPPSELIEEPVPGTDPNQLALVLLARWRDFSMLLTADAEAEAVPLDPGPIDVLKVAHHGSDDAGLAALLDRTRPRLAAISVGADNPYGHPTAATLATLAAHGIRTLRTDLDGDIVIDVEGRDRAVVRTG
ncbi:MAG TPA: ComEC/Rec2 family competence protein [Solirubrobacterales bacterium]|nr:ComEC/Rec2 family competence protein [Solirubrobacterales bacterium]